MKYLLLGITLFLFFLSSVSQVFAVSVVLSNVPSSVTEEAFTVNIEVSEAQENTTNYLRINFYKSGTTNYFGYTYNNTDWYNGSTYTSYFPINIDSNGSWSDTVQGKLDTASSYYQGSGDYNLKVRRYTSGGSYIWSNEVMLAVVGASPTATPTPAPTSTPTPVPNTPTATKTPTATPIKTPTPTPKSSTSGAGATATPKPTSPPTSAPTKVLALSSQAAGGSGNINTAVSSTATSSSTPTKSEPTKKPTPTSIKSGQTAILGVAQSNLSKILIGVGIIFLATCGIIAFRSFRKGKNDESH